MLSHSSTHAEPTPVQYAALGKAVAEWANIESLLGILLSRLLATPDFLARTYTDSMSAVRIQDAISEAAEIHNIRYNKRLVTEVQLVEIRKLNSDVSSLRSSRNKIAHFCWVRQSDDLLFGTNFAGGVYTPARERKSTSTLSLGELTELNERAHDLVERLLKLIPRLPEVTEESLLTHRSSGTPNGAP